MGTHAAAWNQFRQFGPVSGMRWDPHPEPAGRHAGFGVCYAATDIDTAVAEVFQRTRVVDPSADRALTSWTPVRPLRLLDLTAGWALRNDGAHALAAAPRPTCRAWAKAVREDFPDLDGLWTPSTLTGSPTAVMFEPARDSFPAAPAFSRPLDSAPVRQILAGIATQLGFALI